MTDLEVHHQQFRSHWGDDSEANLITLCSRCHTAVHCR
ncbi:MAG: HNH endonuclease [Terriglobales bacterium]